jgi:sensor histidine kinase YesM
MKENNAIKKLYRTAFLTSPLIGIFSILPVVLLNFRSPEGSQSNHAWYWRFVLIGVITLIVLILWMINIWLYKFLERNDSAIRNHKRLRYISSFGCCLVLSGIIMCIRFLFRRSEPENGSFFVLPFIIPTLGLLSYNIVLLIVMDLIILRDKKLEMEMEITSLKLNNVTAQKEQLKGQIHPHFLFNSLNTLKTLMKKSPDDAEKYLLNLSGFLRSSISYSGEDKTTVENEINHCIEYLEMQKVRFRNSLIYSINIPPDIQRLFYLPVFSLQMLMENAIKHNALSKEKPLSISVEYKDQHLIEIRNNINKRTTEISTGLGLKNLSARVKLLTNPQKDITIETTDNTFRVTIPLISQ